MKKFVFAFWLVVFAIMAVSASVSAMSSEYNTIKVGIYYGSSAKSSITISCDAGVTLGYMNGAAFSQQSSLAAASLQIAAAGQGQVSINGAGYALTGGNIALYPLSGLLTLDGLSYRGGLELLVDGNGLLTVINVVNMDDYVAAVTGKEMSPSWNIEALKAQAVCARSYAVANWSKHSSYGFNLCATQNCQVYFGIGGETDSTRTAASATSGQLLLYNGGVAQALFFASDGGSTSSAKYVWGSDYPYLRAVNDIYENSAEAVRYNWTATLTNEGIQAKLAAASVNIGTVTDIRVTGADEYGRAYKVTITGTNGTYDLVNDKTRSFFDFYSQKYTITPNSSSVSLYAAGRSGTSSITVFNCKGAASASTAGTMLAAKGKVSVKNYSFSSADGYTVHGGGWGHGVGMSQYGAKAMGDKGFAYQDILSFYYPGTYLG